MSLAPSRTRIAVLISGHGTNMAALAEAAREPNFPADIACVISSQSTAEGLERAAALNIPAIAVPHRAYQDPQDFEGAILDALALYKPEIICLAGFMRVLSAGFIAHWPGRILNIHPSLLPAFKGLNAQSQALSARVKETGCTVHIVEPQVDTGPIIAQARVPVLLGDTVETLTARIRAAEHALYPAALKIFLSTWKL